MSEPKDNWDRFDILVKPAIAVLAALTLAWWNGARTEQQTAATMSQIAVGILADKNDNDPNNPLREWAISVLQNPSAPPHLSDEAAERLRNEPLNYVGGFGGFTGPVDFSEFSRQLENLNTLKPAPRPLGDDLQND